MTEPNVYRKAADVVRTGGLAKGTYEEDDGSHCMVGAVRVAKYGTAYQGYMDDEEILFLADLLGGPVDAPLVAIFPLAKLTHWNDADERTPEEVIGLLEQAAEKKEADR